MYLLKQLQVVKCQSGIDNREKGETFVKYTTASIKKVILCLDFTL